MIPAQRRIICVTLSTLMLCAATLYATPVISSTTRAGTSNGATGTAISGRAPLPVVVDVGSGTTSSHQTGDAGQIGIRWDEKKYTNLNYDHDTGGGGGVDPEIECTNCFSTFSFELVTISTLNADCVLNTGNWVTAGVADALAFYHDGTGVHGKPIGVRIAESDAVEGTCGSLSDGQWCWGDVNSIGSNRVYVQLTAPKTDPDCEATGHVKVIYGDGEYIELQHSTWNSGNPTYIYVKSKTSDDVIVLAAAPSGASGDISDNTVTGYQAVNPFTDIRYDISVSCPNGGGNCIEDITNGDQRPGLSSTSIDETVGRGPIWAFVFKEGFGQDAIITITATDDANGGTDTQTIEVDETAGGWTSRYLSATGSDAADGLTSGTAWQNMHTGLNWLRTATAPAELVLLAGETIPYGTIPTTWATVTGDRRIRSSVAGTKAIVTWSHNTEFIPNSGHAGDLRIYDIEMNKTGGTAVNSPFLYRINSARGLMMRVDADCAAAGHGVFGWGTGNTQTEDSVIWDCITASTKTAATNSEICVYADYTSTSKRRAMVGTVATTNTIFSVVRLYATHILTAYNDISYGGTGADPCLRLNGDSGAVAVSEYWYSYANKIKFLSSATSAGQMWVLKDNGTGEQFNHILQDSDYMENATASTAHSAVALFNCPNFLSKNCIFNGFTSHYNSGAASVGARIFNTSAYSAKAVSSLFVKDSTGSGAFVNLKMINNAQNMKLTAAGSKMIENDAAFAATATMQVLENIVDWGTVTTMIDSPAGNSGLSAGGWNSLTGKGAQNNYTGNQGKDNDPLFALPGSNDFRLCTASGVPDASCSGASPCIDAGYSLPTVYYDYSGTARNSSDVGAWDDDSTGMSMGGAVGIAQRSRLLGVW